MMPSSPSLCVYFGVIEWQFLSADDELWDVTASEMQCVSSICLCKNSFVYEGQK